MTSDSIADEIPHHLALHDGICLANFVTVVTGLPRSGTSLMMQMLAAGGLEVLADGERAADDDNPKGYWEYAKVKSLRQDSTWLATARGQAVKVIAQLLHYLPPQNYRIIYMDRDLDEILKSQTVMLERSGKLGARLSPQQLKTAFEKQIRAVGKMLQARQVPVAKFRYRECLESPLDVAATVNQFLGGQLEQQPMAAAVDQRLYRQRC